MQQLHAVLSAAAQSRPAGLTEVQWRILLTLYNGRATRAEISHAARVDDTSLGQVLGLLARPTKARPPYIVRTAKGRKSKRATVWCLTRHGRDVVRNRANAPAVWTVLGELRQALSSEAA